MGKYHDKGTQLPDRFRISSVAFVFCFFGAPLPSTLVIVSDQQATSSGGADDPRTLASFFFFNDSQNKAGFDEVGASQRVAWILTEQPKLGLHSADTATGVRWSGLVCKCLIAFLFGGLVLLANQLVESRSSFLRLHHRIPDFFLRHVEKVRDAQLEMEDWRFPGSRCVVQTFHPTCQGGSRASRLVLY